MRGTPIVDPAAPFRDCAESAAQLHRLADELAAHPGMVRWSLHTEFNSEFVAHPACRWHPEGPSLPMVVKEYSIPGFTFVCPPEPLP